MLTDSRLELLCAELERLFDLDELKDLSHDLLGLEPDAIGGGAAKGSFVKALARRCAADDSVEALCDALAVMRDDLDPRLAELRTHGFRLPEEIEAGESLGPYLILRKLGEGRHGAVYVARSEGADVRLKVLRRETAFDRAGLQRFLTHSRLVGSLGHPGLPARLAAHGIGERQCVVHRYVTGQTLAARLARAGAMHIGEARYLLRGILEALAALHARRLVHGNLGPDNILLCETDAEADRVVLLDAGAHHLRAAPAIVNGHGDRLSMLGSPRSVSPEQIQGRLADARSDLYSFGAVMYELLTGHAPFPAPTSAEALMGHLTREPELPSVVGPPGWISPEVDDFIMQLLCKDPAQRPESVEALLGVVESLASTPEATGSIIPREELDARIRALLADPGSAAAADDVEASLREGAPAQDVAQAFRVAAAQLDPPETPDDRAALGSLLTRAARVYETAARNGELAEQTYARLVELDPEDTVAREGLVRVRTQLGKHEDLVEMLLEQCEQAPTPRQKARLLAEIGRIYAGPLDDREQAVVAYAQAFCEDPLEDGYAEQIERLAGSSPQAWSEVMSACSETAGGDLPADVMQALLLRMGRWYVERVGRPDLAVPCYTTILASNPAHDRALEGLAGVYRKSKQWAELGQVLLLRADQRSTPGPVARALRAEAAEILETRMGSPDAARELYEQVVAEDPSHEKAVEALATLYERSGDHAAYVKLLERRAGALSGEEQLAVLLQIAEAHELQLKDLPEAIRRYQAVLALDSTNLDALHGLDRAYSQTGRYEDLIANLKHQLSLATTPRQKVHLWERVAGVWDEEFLNHEEAADAWENVLDLEPENDAALTHLARHYRALERWNDVVIIYERHLDLLSDDRDRRVEKALALARVLAGELAVPERAIAQYEMVLEVDPGNAEALEGLSAVRSRVGDVEGAVRAREKLAERATTPEARSEHYLRAAQLLESHGDTDGAIERYKLAVDANPKDRAAGTILRAAYAARGDANAAAELLEREIEQTEGESARAKLSGELAALCRDRLKNDSRAESWARVTLDLDPTNLNALRVLGDVAFDAGRFLEASRHYEQVVNRTDALSPEEATRVLGAYLEAIERTGAPKKALPAAERLLTIARDDAATLLRVSRFFFEHAETRQAFEVLWDLESRFGEALNEAERALTLYRLGESARRAGDLEQAQRHLERAAALDPTSPLPLKSLAQVFAGQERWEAVVETMYRQLDSVEGEERVKLLIEIGDLAAKKLKEPSYAAKTYLHALSEKPNDRRILGKLMQLYSEEKDWGMLVKVILKLADFVDDDKQKAKYLHTAAMVAWRELHDAERASHLLERALTLDPDDITVIDGGAEVHRRAGNAEALKELLKRQVKHASDVDDKPQMLKALGELADLYLNHFQRLDQAIAVCEAAEEVDPGNAQRLEVLARLYASSPEHYLDKALDAQRRILDHDPFRPGAYRTLRELYTTAKQPDAAWCACQALQLLGQADPDEERFYLRMRSDSGADARDRLNEQDFHRLLVHGMTEPLLTALFTVIEPAILALRARPLKALGFGPEHLIDPGQHQFAAAQALPYAADVLGMQLPPLLQNPNDFGELSFVHSSPPVIVLGTSVVGVALPPQSAAFMAARHLTYYRPGLYVRQLVPTITGLKAWLFAAIKLVAPQFPVSAELQRPVQEAMQALATGLAGPAAEHLAHVVTKLLKAGTALDLKKWIAGVDLTADRAGLILSDDLATAMELIRASAPDSSSVPAEQRVEEVFRYSVGPEYLEVRRKLGIAVDA